MANLSLMALGSSAPEIILSVIEIVAGSFFAGALGPSTIVGSAAFNLFVIVAVCMVALPKGETRRISNMGVFLLTAIFSLFAYIWLIVILVGSSPDVIEVWEGVVTLLFFPLLLFAAFQADKGRFDCTKMTHVSDMEMQVAEISTKDGRHAIYDPFATAAMLRDVLGRPNIDPKAAANIVASRSLKAERVSRAVFRINAARQLMGSHAVLPDFVRALHDVDAINGGERHDDGFYAGHGHTLANRNTVGFDAVAYCVNEGDGTVKLRVRRTGDLTLPASIAYSTADATATAGEDYVAVSDGRVSFEPGEDVATFTVTILDDDEPEDDEHFTVHLSEPLPAGSELLHERATAIVTIIDDDRPGALEVLQEAIRVKETAGHADVRVRRLHGSKGRVSVQYTTADGTAHAPNDYVTTEGTLIFEEGEVEKSILVPIVNDCEYEKDETFTVALSAPAGCVLGGHTVCVVTIDSDDAIRGLVDKVVTLLNLNKDKFVVGRSNWTEQFRVATTRPEMVRGGCVRQRERRKDTDW